MTFPRHPVFAGAVLVLAALALGEGTLLYFAVQAKAKADRRLAARRREWRTLAAVRPAPAAEVARQIEQDLARSTRALAAMRGELKGRSPGAAALMRAPGPKAPADAFFDIASFVERMRSRAAAAGVGLKPAERFGFAAYANAGPEPALIAPVFRERLVAEHLLEALFDAQPRQLVALAREQPATRAAAGTGRGGAPASPDYFEIDPRISARVAGAVEATAFRLTFVGQTVTLRTLLNKLAAFELPLVVRAVEVTPAGAEFDEQPAGNHGGAAPLVARSLSRFTVTVELVEPAPAGEG